MFSSFFKKKAPSGLEYFPDPKTSCFKEWFNTHHTTSIEETKVTYHKAVFDLTIYWLAKFEINIENPYEGKLNSQQKKIRNEIASFELGCWYLSYLRDWLIKQNHKDQKDIFATFVHNFATIPLTSFQMNIDDLKKQMVNRISYYHTQKDMNEIIAMISAQVCSGFAIEEPVTSIPPENYNMLDFNQALISPMLMVWMTRLDTIHDTWEKTFLSPVCLK